MALIEPLSCILCLEANERTTMLEVQLRRGQIGPGPSHIICMKCGAAIAAEYLFREQENRPKPPAANTLLDQLEAPALVAEAPAEPMPGGGNTESKSEDTEP